MSEPVTVVKEVPNAVLYSDGTILVKNVRASYPALFNPKENTSDDGTVTASYQCVGLMPKATHDEAKKLIVGYMNELLKDKGEKGKPLKLPADRKFIKDGDPKDEDDVGKPENEGMWVVSTRETKKPALLDNRKDPKTGKKRRLTDADKDRIYGGCYINMLIRPWFQSNKYGKRLNAGLAAVQFLRDGEAFGQGRISEETIDDRFGGMEDEEEEVSDIDVDDL